MKKFIALLVIILFLISPVFPINYTSAIISQGALKSVVRIICVTDEGTWSGSGMIISNDGYILTNKHVVSGDAGDIYTGCSIGITDNEFSEPKFIYTADTIIAAKGVDLALLKINSTKTDFNYSKVFLYYLPPQGTEIEALGYPSMGGNKITYTKGYVSGVIGSQDEDDLGNLFIKADLRLDAGNSGGPSFTIAGEFMGINSAILAGKYNSLSLIIPSTTILDFLRVNSYDYLITKNQPKDNNQSIEFKTYATPGSTSNTPSSSSSTNIPPDGSLVRADHNLRTDCPTCPTTVYLIENGRKRGIWGESTFNNCGFKWENVQILDTTTIQAIPDGTTLSVSSPQVCWIPKDQRVIRKFPNGTLMQLDSKYWPELGTSINTIYLLENGKKRPFISRSAFEYLGYTFNKGEEGGWESNITYVTEEEFYQYPLGEPISVDINQFIKEGALIRSTWWEDKYDVYIVKYVGSKKFKRLILSPSVFNNYGHLKWKDIRDEDEDVVYSFTTSDLVRVVGNDKVYQLFSQGDTGIKRWINLSAAEFVARGYDPDSIYEINQFDLNSYVMGQPIE